MCKETPVKDKENVIFSEQETLEFCLVSKCRSVGHAIFLVDFQIQGCIKSTCMNCNDTNGNQRTECLHNKGVCVTVVELCEGRGVVIRLVASSCHSWIKLQLCDTKVTLP